MKVDLTTDEAQALLDGINVVIQEQAREIAFFSEALDLNDSARARTLDRLRNEIETQKSARRKIQEVT